MNQPMRKIVIVGGDLHAWSAAAKLSAVLSRLYGNTRKVAITLLDDQNQQPPSVISFGTSVHQFHNSLGVKEADLIARVGGSYKYGTVFKNWVQPDSTDFLYAYSPSGQMINRVDFHHYANRLRLSGRAVSLEAFSVAAVAASEQRFTHPEPNTALEFVDYSMQFDGARYLQFLRAFSIERGVSVVETQLESVHRDKQTGKILSLTLANGDELAADFYFDCTGHDARLLGQELGVGFDSWSDYFPCDQRAELTGETNAGTPLVTSVVQSDSGWRQTNTSSGVRFEQHSFCSDVTSDTDIVAISNALFDNDEPTTTKPLRVVAQSPGIRHQFWEKNCVALGGAAGFAESLCFDPLHFTHCALERWLELFPTVDNQELLATQYNTTTYAEYLNARDVHALRLATMGDNNSLLADKLRDVEWPETLLHRMALFRATGRVAFYESDLLADYQWVSMLIGCGIWPERYDPLINALKINQIEHELANMAAAVKQIVAKLPNHDALLRAIRSTI